MTVLRVKTAPTEPLRPLNTTVLPRGTYTPPSTANTDNLSASDYVGVARITVHATEHGHELLAVKWCRTKFLVVAAENCAVYCASTCFTLLALAWIPRRGSVARKNERCVET